MAVEFYDINDRGLSKVFFIWTDSDLQLLEPVLIKYRQQTGLNIDPYGTTRIHIDHIKLLIKLIDEYKRLNQPTNAQWGKLRNDLSSLNSDIIVVGD